MEPQYSNGSGGGTTDVRDHSILMEVVEDN